MKTRILAVTVVCTVLVCLTLNANGLATDEFGRNQLLVLAGSVATSLMRASVMAGLLFVVSLFLVIATELGANTLVRSAVQIVIDALDSVPLYVWVLAGISLMPKHPQLLTTLLFIIGGLPLLQRTVQGVVRRVLSEPYCAAAVTLGTTRSRLAWRHVLPNAVPHLRPIAIYLLGAAIAIYGGVGVFGFINRQEMDLGVMLLRGKEQAGADPTILLQAVFAYLLIFLVLDWISLRLERSAASS